MRTLLLIALTIVALLAVTRAEEDPQEEYKKQMMRKVADLKEYFKNDPAGQKMAKIFYELVDFVKIVRKKAKAVIKEYAKRLVKEDGEEDDD